MKRTLLSLLSLPVIAIAADSVVVFNEVHYHPANEVAQTEWVELRNLHGVDVDIAGWRLEGGIAYTFPAGTRIAGGAYLVVAKVPGQIAGALGPFTGILDNGGEEIRLVNRSDRAMDVLNYSDDGDWPAGADGSGATLSRRIAYSADGGPLAWSASNQLGGTPGAVNFPSPTDPPTVTTPIPLNAIWKYRDDNVAPPATWKDTAFDDSAWASGGALLYAGSPNITGAGEGLLGYWPLQETSGTAVPNVAPGGTSGTIFNGVTWVNDATRGRVLNFDGVDGYVNAGSIPQPTMANNFTWSFWGYSASTGNTSVVLGNRFSPTNGVGFNPLEFVKFTTASFEFYREGAQEGIDYADMLVNVWTHHAVVKQGATLNYYRNGAAAGSRTITQALRNPQPFYFGGDQVNENWGGRMDDVAVWTKALPAASITGLANGTLTPLTAPTGSTAGTLTTALALGPTTHYFRRAFTFNGDKTRTTLAFQHLLDDGAVVYLNGVEVLRVNMPGGAIAHGTPASSDVTGSFLVSNVAIPSNDLVVGTNVLAVEVHQHTANPDLVFGASLTATETAGPTTFPGGALVLNEIGGANDVTFRVELANLTGSAVSLADYQLRGSNGGSSTLSGSLLPGALLSLDETQMGFRPIDGERLFIVNTVANTLGDGRTVTTGLRGRNSAGVWAHPSVATFGSANAFTTHDEIVINEIMYNAPGTSPEQWVELYNKSGGAVDIGGWHFTDGIGYTFPPGTMLGAGEYALVVWDVAAFNALHPALPRVFGPLSGGLSGKGERVRLRDADDNLADELEYFTGGTWPEFADGGGSSLELKNPNADNTNAVAWAGSNEVANGSWVNVSYDFSGANLESNVTDYSELLVGMVAGGEAFIDDLEVIEDPLTIPRSLLANGNFSGGTAASWRFQGNHRTSTVVDDPSSPGNKVLKIVATGYTEHMSNHCETTLRSGATLPWPINPAKTYRIKYRAHWAGGGNRLQTRLYFNRGARQELLPMPTTGGTPGLQNSRFVANTGPTFSGTTHAPAVPGASQAAVVSARIADSDGVTSATLFYSVNEGAFVPVGMTNTGGVWSGTIPGQALNAKAQFYIQAADALGATATFPANGTAGRAMIPWNDSQAALTLPTGVSPHNVRIVMTTTDANSSLLALNNVMSNEYRPCTVIYDERDIYYGAGVHLKGSEHGRAKFSSRTGFHLSFSPDQLFLGQHSDVAADRSGAGDQFSQKEMLVKRTLNAVGGIPASEDDLCRLIAPGVATGPAILIKAKVDSNEFLDNWLPNGGDGTFFEYELTYSMFTGAIATSTDNGTWEGNKLTQDSAAPGVGVRKLNPGLSKEEYRWYWLIKNNRSADNYAPLITALTALGQGSGPTFITQTNALIDVDGWLRNMAGPVAWSAGDNYAFNSAHNALLFVKPDGKTLYVPWDMDFTATGGATAGITGINTEMDKFVGDAGNRRAYYGHLLDLCNRAFNTGYLSYWAQHYTKFVNEDLTGFMSFVAARETHIRNTINAAIPNVAFAIAPAPPANVAANSVTLTGSGWVNIREFRRADTGAVLPGTWTGNTAWSLSYALVPGPNAITLQFYDFQGALIGTATANVNNTLTPPTPRDWLRITEVHYHPADPSTPGELSASPDPDDFEFIELQNLASTTLDVSGCKFTVGVDATIGGSTTLALLERVVVVRNVAAFQARYGNGPRIIGAYGPADSLSNGGETITLVDATGAVIQSFTYDDAWFPLTDGPGRSLVVRDPSAAVSAWNGAGQWAASTTLGGTPGASNTGQFGTQFDGWRYTYFTPAELANPAISGALVSTNGVKNALRYALGYYAPQQPAAALTVIGSDGTFLTITYRRTKNTLDANFTIDGTPDLVTWTPLMNPPTTTIDNGDGTETHTVRDTIPISAGTKRHLRVRVTLQP